MECTKRDKWIDRFVFGIFLLGISAVTLFLFYRQTFCETGYYESDMKAYILEMQGQGSKYNFPYPVFFKLSALANRILKEPEAAVAFATMLLNSFAILLYKLFLNRFFEKKLCAFFPKKRRWMGGVMLSVVSVAMFFVSMLYKNGGIDRLGMKFIYLGIFTPNPFHNATYLAARPFALLTFFFFVQLLDRYENGFSGKFGSFSTAFFDRNPGEPVDLIEYLAFSLALLIATMTKPSFTLIFVCTAGVIMLYRFIRNCVPKASEQGKTVPEDFKANIMSALALGFCFIPTFVDLLYQYQGVFVSTGSEEAGIGFAPGMVWSLYCGCIPAAICLACAFPICLLILKPKAVFKDTISRFGWQLYLAGFFTAFCFYEKGFRMVDFNFSWGYEYGLFFGFAGAMHVLLNSTFSGEKTGAKRRTLLIPWLVFLAHLICGILYFLKILRGETYY